MSQNVEKAVSGQLGSNGTGFAEPLSDEPWTVTREQKDFHAWWIETSNKDFNKYYPKRVEYGSSDLEIMGDALKHAYPLTANYAEDVSFRSQELAIAFYLLGKISRALGAYLMGKIPSDDTWHDITVYSMMARLSRHQTRKDAKEHP